MASDHYVLDRQFGFCANIITYDIKNDATVLNLLVNNMVILHQFKLVLDVCMLTKVVFRLPAYEKKTFSSMCQAKYSGV